MEFLANWALKFDEARAIIMSIGQYSNKLLIKTTAAQKEVALSYPSVRGLYFLALVFATTIIVLLIDSLMDIYYIYFSQKQLPRKKKLSRA